MLSIRERIPNRLLFRLIAVFLTGICQITAQVKPALRATTSPPNATQQVPSQRQATTTAALPAACDALGDTAAPGAHTVTLFWNASVPASAQPRDAVIGYIVYRSTKPQDTSALPINIRHLTDTACVDMHVAPGQIYYYVTRAVSASGALSGPSNEIRVQIPPYSLSSTE
jgi:hypothetical protein